MAIQGGTTKVNGHPPDWQCSEKQRELNEKLIAEQQFSAAQIDTLARKIFGKEAHELNKLETSGLIDELLHSSGQRQPLPETHTHQRRSEVKWQGDQTEAKSTAQGLVETCLGATTILAD